jgi:branched-chain amino acid transport system substrate-binding protein
VKTRFLRSAALVGLACVALGATACSSGASGGQSTGIPDGPIKIGAIYSLSGVFAAFGPAQEASGNATIAQVNADGGIDGHKLVLDVKNDQSTPTGAVTAAQALVADNVAMVAFIGVSPDTLQAAPVLDKAKVPVITLLTDATFQDGKTWPYIFDDYPDTEQGVYPYASFLKSEGATSVTSINDTTPASVSFAADSDAAVKAAGIPVLKSVSFDPAAVDLTTQVQQLKATGSDWLLANNVVGFVPLYNALNAVGWHPNIIETTSAYYDGASALGDLAPTTYAACNVAATPGSNLPANVTKVLAAATAKLGATQPDLLTAMTSDYDGLLQYKYAAEKADSISGPAVIKVLNTITNKSFSDPNWAYTYTSSDHLGWIASDDHICTVSPLGQYGTPTIAATK